MDRLKSLLEFYKEDPTDTFVLYSLAQEYASVGNVSESRKYYHTLQNVDADYIGLYYHLGKLEESVGNLEDARQIYLDGIEVAERIADAHAKGELDGVLAMLKLLMDD